MAEQARVLRIWNWRTIALVLFAILFVCTAIPLSKRRVDALVHEKHPNAKEIDRFGPSRSETYVLCENNRVILVSTDRSTFFRGPYRGERVMPSEISCK